MKHSFEHAPDRAFSLGDIHAARGDILALMFAENIDGKKQEELLIQMYSVVNNARLSERGARAVENFFDLIALLRGRREGARVHITTEQFSIGVKAGIQDFRNVSFENLDLSSVPYSSDIIRERGVAISLDGALFKNTRVGREDGNSHFSLFRCDVRRAHMESVRIGSELIDLRKDAITLTKKPNLRLIKHGAGSCPSAEVLFTAVILPHGGRRNLYNYGTHVIMDKHVVGITKIVGEKTMLATRTVYGPDGTLVLLRGVLYALDENAKMRLTGERHQANRIADAIESLPQHALTALHTDTQREPLEVWPLRFFSRPWMYEELSKKNSEVEHAMRTGDCAEIHM